MRVEFWKQRNYLTEPEGWSRTVDVPLVPSPGDEVVFEGEAGEEEEFTVKRRAFVIGSDNVMHALVEVAR